jgi:WD40 repeat protein
VRGFPLGKSDIWRIPTTGGDPERVSHHNSRVAYPVFVNDRTLLYVATADDLTGPWLYAMDLDRGLSHRVNISVEQYLSISASHDDAGRSRRLIATVSNPSVNLWTLPISTGVVDESAATRLAVPTSRSARPRFGPGYVVYLASRGGADGLWKFAAGRATELWRATDGAVTAAAAVSGDGRHVCFPVRRQERTTLYCTTSEGTNARPLAESLDIDGPASWSPDGKWIAVSADAGGGAQLYKVPIDGGPPVRLVNGVASNPVWSPDGSFILYSGPQIGRTVPVKAVTPDGKDYPIPELWVYRISENYRFLPGGKELLLMQGGFRRQNFWLFDLRTGRQRQLTNLKPGSSLRSFDVSPDGTSVLFDRVQENSDIVLIELPEKKPTEAR